MKRIITILLILSLGLNLFFIYNKFFKENTIENTPKDNRKEAYISEEGRNAVLSEMRTFLESIQKINQGINENNPQLIIEAGTNSGKEVSKRVPKGTSKNLPQEFKQLGGATHALFDKMALSAKENFNKDTLKMQLSEQLGNCTACHRMFKFVVKK
ncbi:MAG: hypothetical protein Q3983_03140 [Capnocytophaga sp.]|nr:hypothetical protein [Capnocytophaga sp.]